MTARRAASSATVRLLVAPFVGVTLLVGGATPAAAVLAPVDAPTTSVSAAARPAAPTTRQVKAALVASLDKQAAALAALKAKLPAAALTDAHRAQLLKRVDAALKAVASARTRVAGARNAAAARTGAAGANGQGAGLPAVLAHLQSVDRPLLRGGQIAKAGSALDAVTAAYARSRTKSPEVEAQLAAARAALAHARALAATTGNSLVGASPATTAQQQDAARGTAQTTARVRSALEVAADALARAQALLAG